MHLMKVSGLDGMSAIFYQKHWDIIGEDVIKTVINILNSNAPIIELNKSVVRF